MAKVLSGHALAYGLDSSPIIATTHAKLMSLLMGALYLMHMPWITLLLLLLYGAYIVAHCCHALMLFHVFIMYKREHHYVQL